MKTCFNIKLITQMVHIKKSLRKVLQNVANLTYKADDGFG